MDGLFDMLGAMGDGGLFDGLFGDGLVDWLAGAGDFFGPHGVEMGDVLGSEFRGAAMEGRSFWSIFDTVTNRYFDYQIWRDAFNGHGSYQDFRQQFSQGGDEAIGEVRDVLKSHGFMLRQLRLHAGDEGIAPLLQEYEALGSNLPSEELTKRAHVKLALLLHPDKNPGDKQAEEWAKELNASRDYLTDPKKRDAYEDALRRNPGKIEEWLGKLQDGKWEESMHNAFRAAQKRLEGKPLTGAAKWFGELHPTAKGALIFGGVTAVGVGVYALAKAADKKQAKDAEATPDHWQKSLEKQGAANVAPSLSA